MANDDNELSGQTLFTFSEDIDGAERPQPLPVGEYRATIREVKAKMSKNNTRYGAVALFVDPSQYPLDYTDGDPDGTTLTFNRLSLEDTKKGRFSVRKFCESIGVPAPKRDFDVSTLLGLEVKVRVTHELFEGFPTARANSLSQAD